MWFFAKSPAGVVWITHEGQEIGRKRNQPNQCQFLSLMTGYHYSQRTYSVVLRSAS
nr:DUF596 domain-containing protein [Pectobacterium brasiliense]